MPLLTLKNISLAYGHNPLLTNVSLQLGKNERVCLVGRNGTGKSTLLQLLSGTVQADAGEIRRRDTLRLAHLHQEVPEAVQATVYAMVAGGLGDLGALLSDYHALVNDPQQKNLRKLAELQQRIEILDGWNIRQRVETLLSRLSLSGSMYFAACSGGIRRRVMLARALVSKPDLLLLDEPTNHMDIDAIRWLEDFLLTFAGSLIFITHDRALVHRLATRIIELDRGTLTSFPGDYEHYLKKKQLLLAAEARQHARFDKELAAHEVWIRQGIRARRSRNEGRVKKLQSMRRERSRRITQQSRATLEVDAGNSSGKLVIEARDISFHYHEQGIIRHFSTRIMRGDRVGIIGANGSGKSTLLKLLLQELTPATGRVVTGTKLQTAYFDQQREQLNADKSVRDNISDGADYVDINGHSRHIITYMKDFLFPPERINSPVNSLSGGERNRLLLARLFTRPANLLVLDEPTNDLDVETLELLEELLADYSGTLLLVSHDRSFLDRVVTSTLVFEGGGRVREYVGGYADWLRQSPLPARNKKTEPTPGEALKPARKLKRKTKPGYREQQELEALPAIIEKLEAEQVQLEIRIAEKEFYQQDRNSIAAALTHLEQLRQDLDAAYTRWAHLESMQ